MLPCYVEKELAKMMLALLEETQTFDRQLKSSGEPAKMVETL